MAFWFLLHQYFPPTWWLELPRRGQLHHYFTIFLTPLWLIRPRFFVGGLEIFLFLYWAVTEGLRGQSLGKRLLGLKVVNLEGNKIGFSKAIIESLGKAFLLPLDLIISLTIPRGREKRQRLFNHLSDTVVIRTQGKPTTPQVEYVKT